MQQVRLVLPNTEDVEVIDKGSNMKHLEGMLVERIARFHTAFLGGSEEALPSDTPENEAIRQFTQAVQQQFRVFNRIPIS